MGTKDAERILRVKDRGVVLTIGYDDLVKYHGRYNIGGVALAFRVMELGFAQLAPGGVPDRERIGFASGLGLSGSGVIDAVEMATRAGTRGQLRTDATPPDGKPALAAPDGVGKYYFAMSYDGRTLGFLLKPGLIPGEFIELCRKGHEQTISGPEKVRLQQVKENLAAAVLAAAADDLFVICRGR